MLQPLAGHQSLSLMRRDLIPQARRELVHVDLSPRLHSTVLDESIIRLLPLLFVSYAIAYVDRINVSLAKLEMSKDLPGFNKAA